MKDTGEDGTENCLTYGSLAKTSKLISLLRDEQLKSQEPGSASDCTITMRANGRSKPH